MNARKNSDDTEKTASKVPPFEKITAVEETEEARANRMIAAIEMEAEKTTMEIGMQKQQQEDRMQEEALAEVCAYAEKEPEIILATTQQEMKKELAALESSFRARGKKIAAHLADSMLDFTSLSRS